MERLLLVVAALDPSFLQVFLVDGIWESAFFLASIVGCKRKPFGYPSRQCLSVVMTEMDYLVVW